MIPHNSSSTKYWYIPLAGYETRSRRRLQTDLGLDEEAAEAILHLRGQVIELQIQLHRLEVELAEQTNSQDLRLSHYRDFCSETGWIELEIQE